MADMALSESYDIIVIGAGPAGSSAALSATKYGAKVLLIDQKQKIGVPVRCAELVPQSISRSIDFSPSCILQSIDTMITHLPDGSAYEMKGPGFMLDRSLFDKELVAAALLSGARISIGTKAIGLAPEGVIVQRAMEKRIIQSKMIIGADGVHSPTARWLGLSYPKTMVALQYEMVISSSQNRVEVFFHQDYVGGYAWFFPKGRTANVGVGVIPQKANRLLSLIDQFAHRLVDANKVTTSEVIGMTGGAIPCGGPHQTVFGNVLLVGDAAGHTHPITGAGIFNAVVGGEIAGRIAAEALKRRDLQYLRNYENQWKETFGESLLYGVSKRGVLEENWNKPDIHFNDLIQKTWVGFKGYYQERKKRL